MKHDRPAHRFAVPAALIMGAAAALSAGCAKSTGPEGTVAITVKLGANFAESQVTGLKLIIDAPGDAGAALGLSASAAKSYSVGGRNYTTEVTNCDNDSASEFCITFNENPFSASTFKFKLTGTWPESTAFAIRCVVSMQNAREESALREALDDGTPIRFVSGQTRDVTCDVPCRVGYSCEGTLDTTPPVAPIGTGVVPPGPANNNAPVVMGTAEADTTIRIYAGDSTCTATPTTGTVNDAGQFAVVVPVSDDTTTVFFGRVVDSAGNPSGTCPALNTTPYVEDSQAPATPASVATVPASPANDDNPEITGVVDTSTGLVRIFTDSACDGGVVASGSASAFASPGITLTVAANSTTTFFAAAVDDAGNQSSCSSGVTYVEDSLLPPAPSGLTTLPTVRANNNTPVVMGSAPDASTVKLYTDPSCTDPSPFDAGSSALFASTGIPVPISDNTTYTFYAKSFTAVGSASACSSTGVQYIEDSQVSPAPTLAPASSGPAQSTTASLTGATEPDASVNIYTNGGCTGSAAAALSGTPTGAFDASVTVTANATTAFSVQATDPYGNSSSCVAGGSYVNDTVLPTFAGIATAKGASIVDVNLYWDAGTDAVTASGSLVYDICQSTTRGACASSFSVSTTSGAGALSYLFGGLTYDTRYYFLVRALDQAANRDTNTVEMSATPYGYGTVTAITAGGGHTCFLKADGTLWCWGRNSDGQVGYGETGSSFQPVTSPPVLSGVVGVSAGDFHTCAAMADGTAKCWGLGTSGQIGDGLSSTRTSPTTVGGLTNVIAVSAGNNFTCALLRDRTAKCWGTNGEGQLGNGTQSGSPTPIVVSGLSNISSISAGHRHSCATLSDGTARCWGDNWYGQVGDGTAATPKLAPTAVSGLTNVTAISASADSSCAVLMDGTAKCWGRNNKGQLGDTTTNGSYPPITVSGVTKAIGITTGRKGSGHACARNSDGTIQCWGDNSVGQLGNGVTSAGASSTPGFVVGLSNAIAIATGGQPSYDFGGHSCAVLGDGTAKCWGKNDFYQLGNLFGDQTSPVTAGLSQGVEGATAIAAGARHACLRRSDGEVKCWGDNEFGQLGDGTDAGRTLATTVTGLTDIAAIGVGFTHSCAIQADAGTAMCWGNNSEGQLGDTTTISRTTPVSVSGVSNAVSIQGGEKFTCALIGDGTVKCWGDNYWGSLGNDGGPTDSATPVAVNGLANVKALAVGWGHACALVVSGSGVPWCWGRNTYGQIGDGTQTHRPAAVPVTGVTNATALAAGEEHSCALLADGTVKCWGHNEKGQVGDDSTLTPRLSPTLVVGIDAGTAVGVWASALHTCASLANGTVKCWGDNSNGQIGDGTLSQRQTATAVSGLSGAVRMALGGNWNANALSCAVLVDGTVRCWGDNAFGQVGDFTTTDRSVPTSLFEFP